MAGAVSPPQPPVPAAAHDGPRLSARPAGSGWRRLAGRLVSVVVVLAIFGAVLPNLVDLTAVWHIVTTRVTALEAGWMAFFTAASLLGSFLALMAVLPGLRLLPAGLVNVTSTAVSYSVPGGGAAGTGLSVAMLRSLGFTGSSITTGLLVSGWWNLAVKAGMPLLALGLLAAGPGSSDQSRAAAVGAFVVLGLMLTTFVLLAASDRPAVALARGATAVARPVQRWRGRAEPANLPDRLRRFRAQTADLIRRRWLWLTAATVTYHLSLFGVLYVALDAVGATAQISPVQALAVFAVVRQVTVLPITPGSVGVVELGLVGGLHLLGADLESATAGVLLFRFFTFLLYLPAGIPAWGLWLWTRRRATAPRDGPPATGPPPAAPPADVPSGPTARRVRRSTDGVRILLAGLIGLGLWLAASGEQVGRLEVDAFGLVNRLPDQLVPVVWPVMQLGWIGTVLVWSAVMLARRRPGRAFDLFVAGTGAWVLAKVVKDVAGRPRPGRLLDEVIVRGDVPLGGVGFVAGHTAVAAALAAVAGAHVSRRFRWLLWAGVVVVGLARLYVGAHLPLDVLGGAALGWAVGVGVRWARGVPARHPSPHTVAVALRAAGIAVESVRPADADHLRAVRFEGRTGAGRTLFIRAIGRDQWDADLGQRLWRLFAHREPGDEAPFTTARQQIEHEAYLLALAAAAGVRVPPVVAAAATDRDWVLAVEHVGGTRLDELAPAALTDDLLGSVWHQVALLHVAGIAHRHLHGGAVRVGGDGEPWLVSLQRAEAGGPPRARAADLADLLVTTAALVGAQRAVTAALGQLGVGALADAAPLLQPLALGPRTRAVARSRPGLLTDVADALARAGAAPVAPAPPPLRRRGLRPDILLYVLLASAAVCGAVVAIAGTGQSLRALGRPEVGWLALGVLAVAARYLAASLTQLAALDRPLPLGRMLAAQLAGSATSKMGPGSIGGQASSGALASSTSHLRSTGVDPAAAAAAVLATRAAGVVAHASLLVAAGTWLLVGGVRAGPADGSWMPLLTLSGAAVLVGALLSAPLRRIVHLLTADAARSLAAVARRPHRLGILLASALGLTLSSVAAFVAAVTAVGGEVPIAGAALIFLLVTTLAPLSPLPGGLGVVEPGLAGGLVLLGVRPGAAAAGVVLFRILGYWLPLAPAWLALRRLAAPEPSDVSDGLAAPVPVVALLAVTGASASGGDAVPVAPGDTAAATGGEPTPPVPSYRHPADAVRTAAGIAVGLTVALFAAGGFLLTVEVDLFRLVNRLPGVLFGPVNVVMQAGWAGIIPLAALVAVLVGRRRMGLDLVLAGTSAWILAKVVKAMADRGRPGALLDEVVLRGAHEGGLGFVSGHAAVATAIATVASVHLRRPARWALWTVAVMVGLSRIYVGAHFPLDVVAGGALGWAIGSFVHLVRGTPGHLPTPADVGAALRRMGRTPLDVRRVAADVRGSIPYEATTPEGQTLFVKAMGRDQRDADLLVKLSRFVAYRETTDESPFVTPKRRLEHEAYLTILARSAGVRAPRVLSTGVGDHGVAFLVMEHVDGVDLGGLTADEVDDDLLDALWTQVALLHAADLTHRDLRVANVLVDRDQRPWLVDFGFAEAGSGDDHRARDVAELVVSTALVVGADRAVEAAARALGPTRAWAAARFVQPFVLSRTTRVAVRHRPHLLVDVRSALARAAGRPEPQPHRAMRLGVPQPVTLSLMVLGGYAAYNGLVALAGVRDPLRIAEATSARWMGVAVLAVIAGHLATTVELLAAARHRLAVGRTLVAVAAASLASRLTPLGPAGPAHTALYLQRNGIPRARAWDAANLALFAAVAGRIVGTAVAVWLAAVGATRVRELHGAWGAVAALVVVGSTLGVLTAVTMRRTTLRQSLRTLPPLRELVAHPTALTALVLGSVASTAAFVAASVAVSRGVGVDQPTAVIAAVFLVAVGAATVAPVPGGLGVAEATAAVGLIAVGTAAGPAVVAAVAFRLVTFWLPLAPAYAAARALSVWEAVPPRARAATDERSGGGPAPRPQPHPGRTRR